MEDSHVGRIEDLVPTIEVENKKGVEKIEPQVRRFYQKDGTWYAVVQFMAGSSLTSLHVALGVN